jgi:hypothetical protein
MSDAIVIRRWTEWVVEGGTWRSELVVETNVETGADAPRYDPTALEKLIVRTDIRGESRPDRIRIVPMGARARTRIAAADRTPADWPPVRDEGARSLQARDKPLGDGEG